MSVGSFDPTAAAPAIDAEMLATLLGAASLLDADDFGLDQVTVKRLAGSVRQDPQAWQSAGEKLADEQLVALVRFFTLAEGRLSGWDLGAKSPVIPLVRLLKKRGGYPADLTGWIKSNTDNRFLPHGSLMDRL